jgi:hypothetical protein
MKSRPFAFKTALKPRGLRYRGRHLCSQQNVMRNKRRFRIRRQLIKRMSAAADHKLKLKPAVFFSFYFSCLNRRKSFFFSKKKKYIYTSRPRRSKRSKHPLFLKVFSGYKKHYPIYQKKRPKKKGRLFT